MDNLTEIFDSARKLAEMLLETEEGKKLNDEKVAKSDVTTESWTFTLESGSTVMKKVMLSK